MVNLKTKSDKHKLDNEKRRQSIIEKKKAKLSQSQIIKQALSNSSLNGSSKKIVFDDDNENEDVNTGTKNFDINKSNTEKRLILFDDSDSEEETPTITEKVQFSGKKGFELLNLQSTYGNDDRFKIDERFVENDEDDSEVHDDGKAEEKHESHPVREKKKMLNILEGVLGKPVSIEEKSKVKKRQYDMIRYDASKKEHEIYEIKPDPEMTSSSKKKKLRKLMEKDMEEPSKPQVSREKFYKVSGEIKNSFKENDDAGQFSLLQAYGADDVEDEQEVEKHEDMEEDEMERESKQMVELKEEKNTTVAQGIWKESFFFESNDPRFNDCLEFMNKKNSAEATDAAEKYHQTRKKLKEILRLHMKKQLQKKDPFKIKVGGGIEKQFAKSRSNNRVLTSKRKPPRMNSGRKV